MTQSEKIKSKMDGVRDMLLAKNAAYGDAALHPMRVFSNLESIEGLKVRIDDKLSRIKNVGLCHDTEDTLLDLIGYFALLSIAYDEIK